MRFSIIIPVYNRPQEVDELLESLCRQNFKDFEVVVVEDGSSEKCDAICEKYADRLALNYYFKPNSGPGPSRNYGAERSHGEYLIILDSDVIVPENYLETIKAELDHEPCDAFGGPDRAHESFTPIQKAINYAMTSFFTTGGIRGEKRLRGLRRFRTHALWRRHRLEHQDFQRWIQLPALPRSLCLSQTPCQVQLVLPSGEAQR